MPAASASWSAAAGGRWEPAGPEYWFGTNVLGQDIFARSLYSVRTAFEIGLAVAVLSTALGAALGAAATVFTRHEDDGDTVSALEWVIVGASTVSAMVASASVFWRVDSPIPKPGGTGGDPPLGHRIYAGTDLTTTVVSLGCTAVAFGCGAQ